MLTRTSGRAPPLPPPEAGDSRSHPTSLHSHSNRTNTSRPSHNSVSSLTTPFTYLHPPVLVRNRISHSATRSSFAQPRPIMSRPAGNRPTHIPLPNSPFGGPSPNGSPQPTTTHGATSPTSPRNSFIPSFIRTRSRAATLTGGRGRPSPNAEVANPLAATTSTSTSSHRPGSSGQQSVGVTRSVSTPQSGGLTGPCPFTIIFFYISLPHHLTFSSRLFPSFFIWRTTQLQLQYSSDHGAPTTS